MCSIKFVMIWHGMYCVHNFKNYLITNATFGSIWFQKHENASLLKFKIIIVEIVMIYYNIIIMIMIILFDTNKIYNVCILFQIGFFLEF